MCAQALISVSTDALGLPLALRVVERRARLFWPAESVRRSTVDMRPAGAPGTHRPPLLALARGRGSPFVVILCGPAGDRHLAVYQIVMGAGGCGELATPLDPDIYLLGCIL